MSVSEYDVLAAIDARGGSAYPASVLTGLSNRCVFATPDECRLALRTALARGVIVQTPMGLYRRPPQNDGE